ncbi:MAG: hypothetical protein ACFFD2_09865 [Promethearchaeota archaeon]
MRKMYLFALIFSAFFLVIPFFSMFLVSINAYTSWNAPIRITFDDYDDYQVVITHQDFGKVIHIAWVKEIDGITTREIFYANSTNWDNHIRITNDSMHDFNPMIDVDCCGTVHIVWVKEVAPENSDIFYTNSTDWSYHVNVSRKEPSSHNYLPTLAKEYFGSTVHIAWTAGADIDSTDIYYRKNVDGKLQKVVNTPDSPSIQPSITLDKYLGVHLVWVELGAAGDWDIWYTNSSSWPCTISTDKNQVSDVCQIDNGIDDLRPDISVDNNNISHVTWYGTKTGTYIYYSFNPLNTFFLTPWQVSNTTGDINPSIVLGVNTNPVIIYEGGGLPTEINCIDYNGSWAPLPISFNLLTDNLELASIGALDIDLEDNLYAAYSTNTTDDFEIYVVDGMITTPGGIPGFNGAIVLLVFLGSLVVWQFYRKKSIKTLPN